MTTLGFNLDALIAQSKKKGGIKTERLEANKTARYRILPPADASKAPVAEYFLHWILGPNGKKFTALCTYGTERFCPLCKASKQAEEVMNKLKEQFKEGDAYKTNEGYNNAKNAFEYFRSSRSVVYPAMNAANELVYLSINKTVSDALIAKISEAVNDRHFDPLSLESGVWFSFKKDGKGRDSVTVDFARGFRENGDEYVLRDALPPAVVDAIKEGKTPDVTNMKALWIRHFSASDLQRLMDGKASVDQLTDLVGIGAPKVQAAAAQADTDAEGDDEPSSATPPTQTLTAPATAAAQAQAAAPAAPVAQAPAPVTQTAAPAPVAQAPAAPAATAPAATTAPAAPTGGVASSTASEIAKLRAMMSQGKK